MRVGELSLADALLLGRERDRLAGYTSVGPHRADWSMRFAGLPGREALSRGQTKLAALAALLAQASDYASRRGQWAKTKGMSTPASTGNIQSPTTYPA